MNRCLLAAVLLFAPSVLAQPASAEPAMDMSKMGPWARKPTNEGKTKKEIAAFLKEEEALNARGDLEAVTSHHDFPIYMMSDDAATGAPGGKSYTREEYVAEMKPFFESMPKDMKYKHKYTIDVLSDSLASVSDEFVMTMGGKAYRGRNHSLLVKVAGQWRWKVMTEAGWGGAGEQPKP